MKNSSLIMTDSGGMQKEAYFFDKYCITLRDETEWIELVENHANKLAGADKSKILEIFTEFSGKKFASVQSLYGDGDASGKIVDYLLT
jgi:UDP-GlcNAc3NAcA epimerase